MPSLRVLVLAGLATLALIAAPANAATLTVTNTADSGAGSLRDALASAAAGDTIVFAPSATGTVALAGPLSIAQSVTIQGPGAASLVLDGQAAVRVFLVSAGDLTLSGVTLTRGSTTGLGGAIGDTGTGTVTVTGSVFTGNTAANGGAIAVPAGGSLSVDTSTFANNTTTGVGGGAVIASGAATVSDSTFVGNTAPVNGGAINTQPGGTLTVVNCTFSGNTSTGLGGALSNLGTLSVINATFSANHGSTGAVLASGNSNVTLDNNVIADNVAGASPAALSPTGLATTSHNVFYNNTAAGTADDQTGYGTSNFVVAAAEPLQPLGDNGGPTRTMMPVPGGAAACAGSVALLPVGLTRDQRGDPRTTLVGSTVCLDAGAVQGSGSTSSIPTLSGWMLVVFALSLAVLGMRRL